MSLRVWLPLRGDLTNQGLDDITVTNNGATVDDNGKIGKCYYFNASAYLKESIYDWTNFNTSSFSLCCWYKEPSPVASGNSQMICIGTSSGWNNIRIGLLRRPSNGYPMFSVSDGNTAVRYSFTADNFPLDTWVHIACTYNNGTMKMYLNGQLHKTYTTTIVPVLNSSQHLGIGAASNGAEKLTGYLNDVRIYDHTLSPKEVEEISRGLILHYKLDQNCGEGINLVKNGFGELGTLYWPSARNTSDIPSDHPEIKASFAPGTNTEAIPITRNTTYKFSTWIKSSATSGSTYPSLLPYDIDGKFIGNQHSLVGFNLNTMTTISQILKPGDTEIYVDSLANWNSNSGHNYNYAAIFGYQDSTGHIYPDGTYTQNIPAFGSSTNAKTNLDKANNIIHLNSAYTGPTIAIGTKVCAATAGSSYFYPLGAVSCASVQDWTYKEATFSSEDSRLLAATSVKLMIFSKSQMAGMSIVNQDTLDSVIYDSSGYQNNGTIVGEINGKSNSPRYSAYTYLNSSSPTTNNNTGLTYIKAPLELTTPIQMTICWWGHPESGYGGTSSHAAWCTSASSSAPSDYNTTAFHHRDTGFDICPDPSGVKRLTFNNYTLNEWHYYCVVYDGKVAILYKDGIESNRVTVSSTEIALKTFTTLFIGYSRAGGVYRKTLGGYSDFRIYVTALTPEQIEELYNTSASVDNQGNVYAREVVEKL